MNWRRLDPFAGRFSHTPSTDAAGFAAALIDSPSAGRGGTRMAARRLARCAIAAAPKRLAVDRAVAAGDEVVTLVIDVGATRATATLTRTVSRVARRDGADCRSVAARAAGRGGGRSAPNLVARCGARRCARGDRSPRRRILACVIWSPPGSSPDSVQALDRAIDDGTLGEGSIAGDEYLRNMAAAREREDGRVQWVEVCYCPTPLAEEREYWEPYFDARKGAGRPRAQPLPRSERHRAVGVRRLRLHRRASKRAWHAKGDRFRPKPSCALDTLQFILASCRRLLCRRCWRAPARRSSAAAAPKPRRCSRPRCVVVADARRRARRPLDAGRSGAAAGRPRSGGHRARPPARHLSRHRAVRAVCRRCGACTAGWRRRAAISRAPSRCTAAR